MKDIFEQMAEEKIRAAIRDGEYKDLPGTGKPLYVENFYFLPPEFRFAYTVLRNTGFLNLGTEKAPVPSSNKNEKSQYVNPFHNSDEILEKSSDSFANDEINSSKMIPSNPSENNAKALNFSVIKDCKRRLL
jgi:hypothetical protein